MNIGREPGAGEAGPGPPAGPGRAGADRPGARTSPPSASRASTSSAAWCAGSPCRRRTPARRSAPGWRRRCSPPWTTPPGRPRLRGCTSRCAAWTAPASPAWWRRKPMRAAPALAGPSLEGLTDGTPPHRPLDPGHHRAFPLAGRAPAAQVACGRRRTGDLGRLERAWLHPYGQPAPCRPGRLHDRCHHARHDGGRGGDPRPLRRAGEHGHHRRADRGRRRASPARRHRAS